MIVIAAVPRGDQLYERFGSTTDTQQSLMMDVRNL
jgi:hypothetical protein